MTVPLRLAAITKVVTPKWERLTGLQRSGGDERGVRCDLGLIEASGLIQK